MLHYSFFQAEPLDGGQIICSGRMWVNPVAEHDLRAVRVSLEGRNLPFEPIILRYLPKVAPPDRYRVQNC
jgi:hypothetical protein